MSPGSGGLDESEGRDLPANADDRPSSGTPRRVAAVEFESSWAGPLPPPEALAQFEAIAPGLAMKLVDMAVAQQAHDNEMERSVLRWEGIRSLGGLLSGFLVAVLMILTSGFVIYHGHDVAGAAIAGATLVGLVAVFLQRDRAGGPPSDAPP
ncbi:MAG TPA: DUF2335 domain-containing protein [Tepidiformaceae bacterium]|nr:DUF2335 domain-containing protein [Tepidiformaceae bacterium]